ncbi:hypothetical protein Nepgr_023679 [Nepenthes gracilis]|uniref:Glutaredoxin-like protein n=1 Tax=Nepenthes gracilis TaxID=150966 RepID=A0AAD3T399_NEPGR|nr:hypothetical protein Nepgr_023679 [Nepenthes gracilis]
MSISSFNQMSMLLLGRQRQKQKQIGVFKSLASNFLCSSSFSSTSNSKTKKLILYSKPGCCLCDGLKEKLHAAFSLSVQDSLHDIHLEVRDITTNPEWERAYQYEIPVLAKVGSDGAEVTLPRLSPRLGVEFVHRKIADAFRQ